MCLFTHACRHMNTHHTHTHTNWNKNCREKAKWRVDTAKGNLNIWIEKVVWNKDKWLYEFGSAIFFEEE